MTSKLKDLVDMMSRGLGSLDRILDKGAAHAASTGASEADMLKWRLADDMYPIGQQATTVIGNALQWGARAAGVAEPTAPTGDLTVAQLKAEVAKAKDFLAGLKPEAFEGRDDLSLKLNLGREMEMTVSRWLQGIALPNFYFHLTCAYAILRQRGAPLGKGDFLAGGF